VGDGERVAAGGGAGRGVVQDRGRVGEAAELDEREAEIGRGAEVVAVVVGEQAARPLEEARARRQVAAVERRAAGRPEAVGRGEAEGPAALAGDRVQLGVRVVRALEVEADQLVAGIPVAGLEPGGVALVQVDARRLRHELVGDVADQDVGEAVADLAGDLGRRGADELPPRERREAVVEVRGVEGRQQPRDRAAVERPALDRRAVEDGALGGRKAVDACREQRLDRRGRPGRDLARLVEHRDHLLEEERVALGRREQPRAVGRARDAAAREAGEQVGGRLVVERGERDDRATGSRLAPLGPALEQLRAGEADHEQRHARGAGGDVLERVDQRRLGPVDIVEDQDERAVAGGDLEQAPDGPVRLLDRHRARCGADQPRDPLGDAPSVGVVADERSDRRLVDAAGERADDLGQRPVGDALAVGHAAPGRDRRPR
jgi:hypothetical protein